MAAEALERRIGHDSFHPRKPFFPGSFVPLRDTYAGVRRRILVVVEITSRMAAWTGIDSCFPWPEGRKVCRKGGNLAHAQVMVVRITGRETIVVNGHSEPVRLISENRSETMKQRKPVQDFGEQASQFRAGLIEGQRDRLEIQAVPTSRVQPLSDPNLPAAGFGGTPTSFELFPSPPGKVEKLHINIKSTTVVVHPPAPWVLILTKNPGDSGIFFLKQTRSRLSDLGAAALKAIPVLLSLAQDENIL